MKNTATLPPKFFERGTHRVAKELLGKLLVRKVDNQIISGRIVETESYVGEDDAACHASRGRTPRTEIMFSSGGHAYVYFIYGMYYCLNIVTERKNFPAAVLIRALEPVAGIPMMQRRRRTNAIHNLTSGPGKLCQALSIDRSLDGFYLGSSEALQIIDDGVGVRPSTIQTSPRIGVAYAGADAQLPWRYYIKSSPFVSATRSER